jgi:transcriptional regulator with XRE-family HTH domain
MQTHSQQHSPAHVGEHRARLTYARLLRDLFEEADLPIIELGRHSGLSVSLISRVLSGHRSVTGETRDRLAAALALGHRDEGDDAPPVHALARWSPGDGYAFLADESGRVAVVASRPRAEQVAALLAEIGVGEVVAVPAWPQWLHDYAEHHGSGLVILDHANVQEAGRRIGRFMAEYAVALRAVPVPVGIPA